MKFKNIAYCLLIATGALTSCIKEDRSDCFSDNLLMLSYKGDGTTEIFGDKICRVEMYVFDSQNQCLHTGELSKEELESRTVQLPQLSPGDYKIVCIGNTHHTDIQNLSAGDFSEITFAANDYRAGRTPTGNDSLYYACDAYTITYEDQTQIMEFASSHYDVLVEVAQIPDPTSEGGRFPTIEMDGLLPETDFNNRAFGTPTTYQPETTYDADKMTMTARFNIMRHGGTDGKQHHDDVNVHLTNSNGTEIAKVNLGEFINQHSDLIDCSKNEVLIPIRFTFLSGNVVISIPDWYVEEVNPDYH